MSVELSISGPRVVLLTLGLVLVGVLLFFTGMVVEAGRVVNGSAHYVIQKQQQDAAAALAAKPKQAPPPTLTMPAPPSHRLRPLSTPTTLQRVTPIPVVSHPPPAIP